MQTRSFPRIVVRVIVMIVAAMPALTGCGTLATAPKAHIANPETQSCDMPPPGTRVLRIGPDS